MGWARYARGSLRSGKRNPLWQVKWDVMEGMMKVEWRRGRWSGRIGDARCVGGWKWMWSRRGRLQLTPRSGRLEYFNRCAMNVLRRGSGVVESLAEKGELCWGSVNDEG